MDDLNVYNGGEEKAKRKDWLRPRRIYDDDEVSSI